MNEPNHSEEIYIPHAKLDGELYAAAMSELLTPYPAVRIPMFPCLDELIGGLRSREFTILCGATGVGKTTLIANLSAALLINQDKHFVASVETGATDFLKRLISIYAKQNWNTGKRIDVEKLKDFDIKHGSKLTNGILSLSLYDNRFKVETLIRDILWMVNNRGVKIAMIDNLNFFMEVTSAQNQIIEMDRVVHELIVFCKQVDVHLIMVMHPKKTDHGRVENEFEIKGSSTAVQEAHNIFLWNRPHEEMLKNGSAVRSDRELKIVKMRRCGSAVGTRLMFKTTDGVCYSEGDCYELK